MVRPKARTDDLRGSVGIAGSRALGPEQFADVVGDSGHQFVGDVHVSLGDARVGPAHDLHDGQ